jgi:REP element-mobilizing transposase RayT
MMQDSKIQNSSQLIPENKNPNLDNHRIDGQEEILPNTTGPYEVSDPYLTSFVCLLIPRFEEHILIGDLVDNLHTWMKDTCISFGWNIRFIEISPNYLHWIMTVKLDSSPVEFMNIVRRTTSKKVFDEFPRFSKKNMSKRFWAPLYFVGVGNLPYSKSAIQSFIEQIRMEQGL